MHTVSQSLFGRALTGALLVVGLLVVVALNATTAYAHDSLIESTPSDGQAVQEAPAEIELVYSGNIGTDPEFTQIAVLGPDGQDHADGDPVVEGDTVTQPVTELSDGDYEIGWRVVSSDGHPIEDSLTFSVEGGSDEAGSGDQVGRATDGATQQAQPEEPDEQATTETSSPVASETGEEGGSTRWIVAALVAAVVVGIGAMLLRRGRVPDDTA